MPRRQKSGNDKISSKGFIKYQGIVRKFYLNYFWIWKNNSAGRTSNVGLLITCNYRQILALTHIVLSIVEALVEQNSTVNLANDWTAEGAIIASKYPGDLNAEALVQHLNLVLPV